MKATSRIYLDTRRELKDSTFPLKLRITFNRKQKYYGLPGYSFTKEDFKRITGDKPRGEFKDLQMKLNLIEQKAVNIINGLPAFTFQQFEKRLYRKSGEGSNVFYHYQVIIDRYKKLDRIGTANNYQLSLKSLKEYINKDIYKLSFNEVTPAWLEDYERYMLNTGRSRTTISIYLRSLRAVFNAAINEGDISREIYPFGLRKYQLPSVRKVKKSLTREQLKQLFEASPRTPEQEKAKDFWFLLYSFNGMNVKDLVSLRYKDIENDKITYFRAKTVNTAKADLKAITVYLNDFSRSIIKKYGSSPNDPGKLIFSVINDRQNATKKHSSTKNFVRFINQNLKKLAIIEGLPVDISVQWSRHSFATNAIRQGASMEFVSEALNHSDMQVTQGYFTGFEDEAKREMTQKLMNF
ncbi:Tyrosine recombinase XerC [subsurface metagenome]